MRRMSALVGFYLLVLTGAGAADLGFVRVWTQWYDADPFIRISEYFTGRPHVGERDILRTQPKIRAGFYFLVRVKNPGPLVSGTTFVVSVILPGAPDPHVFTFATDVPAGGKVYELGLTGADWPGKKIHPLAWKLDLLGADGRPLVTRQSFLWSKPD
jgi:hypothetical protein